MPTSRTQTHGGGRDPHEDTTDAGTTTANINTHGSDDLLDEIDGLLENNAAEFVAGYIQKGGQ